MDLANPMTIVYERLRTLMKPDNAAKAAINDY